MVRQGKTSQQVQICQCEGKIKSVSLAGTGYSLLGMVFHSLLP